MSDAPDLQAQYRSAYAKQARADLDARDRLLEHPELPDCQQLHFLQMACEKLCKAHLCGQGTDPEALRASHAYIAGPQPVIARQQFALQSGGATGDYGWMVRAITALAEKIERLAPAVTRGGTVPANCEYPWVGPRGTVLTPAEHDFEFDLLYEKAGIQLIKLLRAATDDLIGRAEA